MDKWYISVQSRARGPFSDGQIRKKIQSGELVSETLMYREGDLDWRPLSQQSLWSPLLKEDFFHAYEPEANSKVWVLLVENPLKKKDFQQQGPFRQSEVIEKYDSGEVQPTDYIWRPGMQRWSNLKDMPELVLSRKPAVSFDSDTSSSTVEAKNLANKSIKASRAMDKTLGSEESKTSKKVKFHYESSSDVPVFISTYSLPEVEEVTIESLKPPKRSYEPEAVGMLPLISLKKEENKNRIVKLFLALILVSSLLLSVLVLKRTDFKNSSLVAFKTKTQEFFNSMFTQTFTGSYLMISPSLIDKKLIGFQTDASVGSKVEVSILNSDGREIRIKNSLDTSAFVAVDPEGRAIFDISRFRLKGFQKYTLLAKMGGLKAKKSVLYVP